MRALLSTAAVVGVALALGGCSSRQQQPVPGPKSATASGLMPQAAAHAAPAPPAGRQERGLPDEINWFQGTLEEAFSRRPSTEDRPQFRN
jgi:hypothetical protein